MNAKIDLFAAAPALMKQWQRSSVELSAAPTLGMVWKRNSHALRKTSVVADSHETRRCLQQGRLLP